MYETPMKQQNSSCSDNRGTSLKNAINQRLSSTKNKYCMHQRSLDSKSYNAMNEQLDLIRKLTEYQSKSAVGYFKFDDWITFNQVVFPHVRGEIIRQLWKIMRMVNYGEVVIPTGLIYEISHWFAIGAKQNDGTCRKSKIKSIINEFLSINGVSDTLANFRQLSIYMSLQDIQAAYIGGRRDIVQITENKSNRERTEGKPSGQVFNRCYKDAKKRQQSLIKLKYASLMEETKQCNFKPDIKRHQSNKKLCAEFYQSNHKCMRVCHQKDKYLHQNIENYNEMINSEPLFKAKPIDPQIYNKNIEAIPGVSEHLMRKKVSEGEKQRLIRQSLKPGKWNTLQSRIN